MLLTTAEKTPRRLTKTIVTRTAVRRMRLNGHRVTVVTGVSHQSQRFSPPLFSHKLRFCTFRAFVTGYCIYAIDMSYPSRMIHQPGHRLNELLDAIKQEFESVTNEASMYRMHKDEYDHKGKYS